MFLTLPSKDVPIHTGPIFVNKSQQNRDSPGRELETEAALVDGVVTVPSRARAWYHRRASGLGAGSALGRGLLPSVTIVMMMAMSIARSSIVTIAAVVAAVAGGGGGGCHRDRRHTCIVLCCSFLWSFFSLRSFVFFLLFLAFFFGFRFLLCFCFHSYLSYLL